ncbi:MAG: hypothetical protein ACRD03_01340, partial [Acidimicrobiales bacterium]
LRIAGVVGLAGVVSAFVASQISVGMSETASNVLFALLLLVVAVRMLWQQLAHLGAGAGLSDDEPPPGSPE